MPGDRALRILIVIVAAIALIALVCAGIWMWKSRHDTAVITNYVKAGNAKAEADMTVANESAAAEEVIDTVTVADQRKELSDAMDPSTLPAGMSDRQRRGCIILRQQGQDLARFPACAALATRP
jgi:FtsZ-interacting cell division protein ZipA